MPSGSKGTEPVPTGVWVRFINNEITGQYFTNIETGEIRQVDLQGRLWRKVDGDQFVRVKLQTQLEGETQ